MTAEKLAQAVREGGFLFIGSRLFKVENTDPNGVTLSNERHQTHWLRLSWYQLEMIDAKPAQHRCLSFEFWNLVKAMRSKAKAEAKKLRDQPEFWTELEDVADIQVCQDEGGVSAWAYPVGINRSGQQVTDGSIIISIL